MEGLNLNIIADNLFMFHPDPMWVYDLDTLCFLAVNDAAVKKYGYSRDEFLAMTIADIRPEEDRRALTENVASVTEGRDEAGVWRHVLKSGEVIFVDITGHIIDHDGHSAELIAVRDVTRFVIAEQPAQKAWAREKALRQSTKAFSGQFQIMFESAPGMALVLAPESLNVVAVSDAYLSTLCLSRHDVVGHHLFDVLPPQPGDPERAKLRRSVDRVLATGDPDLLGVQSFLLPRMGARCWAVCNSAVIGPGKGIVQLILRMQDLTEEIDKIGIDPAVSDILALEPEKIDLFPNRQQFRTDDLYLSELGARLRTTQRLLGTGTWDYVIADDRLEWSHNVYGMYGTTPNRFGHGFEDYVALVHPDDRDAMRNNFAEFMASGDANFSFAHKVQHPDGPLVHVRGVAEKVMSAERLVLRGVVQDVTKNVEAENALAQAKRMLEIAGTSAKFGAWRYDVHTELLEWSPQTARIHDETEGFSPKAADALHYYLPEHRDRVAHLFKSCLEKGESFDETFQIKTAIGRRLSIRVTGEAECDEAGRISALYGSIQDISELVTVRKRAEASERLLQIAGRAVKLGGWRVTLEDQKVYWTDGIAAIHELPPGTPPSVRGGIDFFAPEDREDARRVFEDCVLHGIPFNNVRELITAKGNRAQVRSIGEPVRDDTGKIVAVQGAMQDITELTAALKRADELDRRLAETLENIGDAFFTIDQDWRFTYFNGKAESLLERKRDELIGRSVMDEFPEIAGSAFEAQYTRAFVTGGTVRFEQYYPPLDRTFSVSAHPTPAGLAVYFTDISDERRQTEQLRLLKAAVEQISDIVIITDVTTSDPLGGYSIVYVNEAFERITGVTRDEAIGQTPRILHGPKTQRSELNRINQALAAHSPVRAELINYTKSGQEYWLELDIVPLANEAGSVTHFVAVQRDITDRRRAEEALRISETRFRLIAEATGNAAWEWDIAAGRLWWSDAMTELFGHQPEPTETLHTVSRANVHPDDEERVVESLNRLLSGQVDAVHGQHRFRRVDGTWANVENHAFLIRDNEGRACRILGSMADISERLEMEERFRQSQKLEAVGQITGGVAHDFNNLLTIIIGNTEMLQEELDVGHPLRKYADMSALAADRATELTNRLLAFSRKQALHPQVIDVNLVIDGIEEMLRRTLGEYINIKIVLAGDLWSAEVDLAQLESSLLNLAINSRDAMPYGGALTIETANVWLDDNYVSSEDDLKSGRYIVIAVSDTGHGISKDQIERVFEPFFTTKAVGKGTGLGLSMVHGFVKQSGGHIRIYSEMNEGTTVKLYFPRFSDERLMPEPETQDVPVKRGQETILIVEDDTLILQQLMTQLTGLGYTVITAGSGAPALAILKERSDIDLLFTDVILPGGMNGRQIADAAQDIQPGLKVLYTSGYSENAIVHHGRLDRGVELLSKPYRRSELALSVRKVLES